jgi:hypothetical protein
MSAIATVSPAHIISRIAAGLLGGWLFVWGCATLGVTLGLLAGIPYRELAETAYLLAFLVFLGVFCWAFAAASLVRVWLVLGGGGVVMSVLAWALARSI